MLNNNIIKEMIKGRLRDGYGQFVIYPFGENGARIKYILKEYFGLEPVLIVDREYNKYNVEIADFEKLRYNYKNEMVIFLTIEDPQINAELYAELLKFVPQEQIINLFSEPVEEKVQEEGAKIPEGLFALENILPNEIKPVKESNKIKIRFLHHQHNFWNSISSICKEFKKDSRYEILIILRDNDSELLKSQMKQHRYSCVMLEDYDVEMDRPDILVMYHINNSVFIKDCRKYTKLIVFASIMLMRYHYRLEDFWKYICGYFDTYEPDYYLFDSLIYNEIKASRYNSSKVIEMGNAKFDGIYEALYRKKDYSGQWRKLKNKKVILWTTDHGISDKLSDFVTFDLYARCIFEYANEHPETAFIIRLHASFVKELLKYGYWKQTDIVLIKQYCKKTPNIVWDESESYDRAYSIADGILTDALCGITISALPTLKPICVMYRNQNVKTYHPEITDSYYAAYNEKELLNFLDMIRQNKDEKKELRKAVMKKCIKHFDGCNGERIKNFIECKYQEINKDDNG